VRVVLDTNVIISALNFDGTERHILTWAKEGRYELCLSAHILHETEGVLVRKFLWSADRARLALKLLIAIAELIEPESEISRIAHHRADNLVLACAVDAHANYLVTGDRKHLLPLKEHDEISIISASEFRQLLEQSGEPHE
jgi:uncharacterized protein